MYIAYVYVYIYASGLTPRVDPETRRRFLLRPARERSASESAWP